MAQIQGNYTFSQDYLHVRGFRLRPGGQGRRNFDTAVSEPLDSESLKSLPVEAPVPIQPDLAAYDLVEQVYAAFGYGRNQIPLFDASRRFDPDAPAPNPAQW